SMTAPTIALNGSAATLLTRRVRAESVFYAACLVLITIGFYGYWGLLKLKVVYVAWAACFVLALWLSFIGRLKFGAAARNSIPILAWLGYELASSIWSPSTETTLLYLRAAVLYPVAFTVSFVWARTISRRWLALFFELH